MTATADIEALRAAVELTLAQDPAQLAPRVALERVVAQLELLERAQAAALTAIADIEARELFALAACGSTRGLLRTLPVGDRGQVAAARRLRSRPLVREALADGTVGTGGAAHLCAALTQIDGLELPDAMGRAATIGEDQLLGLLVHGLAPLLDDWTGGRLDSDLVTEQHLHRREVAAGVLTAVANDVTAGAADRLEPALVLLAGAVPSSALAGALGILVDALRPEQLDAEADAQHVASTWSLTRRSDGGWDLRAVLDDETGARLDAEVRARHRAARRQTEAAAEAAAAAVTDAAVVARSGARDESGTRADASSPDQPAPEQPDPVPDHSDAVLPFPGAPLASALFGSVGAGVPVPAWSPDGPVEGPVGRSWAQTAADAFAMLLDDLAAVEPGTGAPTPAQLTVLVSAEALTGTPGAAPAVLETSLGPIRLAPEVARRLGCGGDLATVTLDDSGNPVTASGTHRNATRRERRAMKARWGSTCAVNGCPAAGPVPHHVEPFWKSGLTRVADLVPVCTHHHHDVHEGHRMLRLRDGRLIGPAGWVTALVRAA